MTQSITLEVTISLEDFFRDDEQKSFIFRQALKDALINRMHDSQWVQQNIAFYLFQHLKDDEFQNYTKEIRQAIREGVQKHKNPDRFFIQSHHTYKKILDEVMEELSPVMEQAAMDKAKAYISDDNTNYGSFHQRLADACVDKVFSYFVTAMVDKENSK